MGLLANIGNGIMRSQKAGPAGQRTRLNPLNQWLLWTAAILTAAAAAIGSDLLCRPQAGRSVGHTADPGQASWASNILLELGPDQTLQGGSPPWLALSVAKLLHGVTAPKGLRTISEAEPTPTMTAGLMEPSVGREPTPLPLASATPAVRTPTTTPAIATVAAPALPIATSTGVFSPTLAGTPFRGTPLPAFSDQQIARPALDFAPLLVPDGSQVAALLSLVTPPSAPVAERKGAFQVDIPNRYLNIVVLGSDKRPRSSTWRTDAMIVVSVDLEDAVVRLLSIPRDLWVYVPGHGYDRINTADLWGTLAKKGDGPERVKQTIHHNLGIPIHYYFRVDMRGFVDIIDTVGGLDIDVDCPLPDIDLKPGIHHMDGEQALAYARSRKSTNDFDRTRRQRKVLLALWDQALTWDIIPSLPQLWVTLAAGFETDLPLSQVVNLAYVGVQLKPQRILSSAVGRQQVRGWTTPQGAQVLVPREDRMRELLEGFYARKDLADLDAASGVRVQILNGSQRSKAEKLAAATLRWGGFRVVDEGLADNRNVTKTEIRVYQGDLGVGQQLADILHVPTTAVRDLTGTPVSLPGRAVIQVLLGTDYNPCQR
jgi:polyisoprenyl-teichoic acid--peptidoglycan teichoic acid transferase